jgi:hypothetical protein
MLNRAGSAAAGLAPPPCATSASPAMEPLPQAPHCIPRTFPLPPPSICEAKHQLRVSHFIPINVGHSCTLITSRRPPPQPLYKRRAPPFSTAPLPTLLLFSLHPSTTRTERLFHCFFTTVARPPRCRRRPGEAQGGLPMHPSPHCTTSGGPPCPRAVAQPTSIKLCGQSWWSVHHGPRPALVHEPWTEFTVISY